MKTTDPIPTDVNTPGATNTFYNEDHADMTTATGRVAWFCAHFELDPPALSYDEDEPDQLLLTDELIEFCSTEGVSLDWLVSGHVGGPLSTFREKYRVTPQSKEFVDAIGKFDEHEKRLFLAGLKLIAKSDADVEDVMDGVNKQIREYRANQAA